ncbi:MAG: thioredoxin-like domain-containing protein [Bacteroidia bacterium]
MWRFGCVLLPLYVACQKISPMYKKAPAFPKDFIWLNTDKPLTWEALQGKFVLLDFWTYCCINCMHVLPDLKRLEKEFPELVVIGVHSAKFDNETEVENIRQAILRYDIEHPVIVDRGYTIWQRYAIRAWPSFVLVDPKGYILARSSGEGIYEALQPFLSKQLEAYRLSGELRTERLTFRLEKSVNTLGILAFPGKIRADRRGKRLFVSDSNHNRILILSPSGEVLEVVGSGAEGAEDGSFDQASFFRPQGLAYDENADVLYVADTDNHLIRLVDFQRKEVRTIAGTGQQARSYVRQGQGTEIALNSPWDVCLLDGYLYIAMAGPHQIWRMDLSNYKLEVYAGSGYENLIDGPRLTAALAQPSGITTDGKKIYFVDSETSSLRVVEGDQVRTLIGKGLFDFGDAEGSFNQTLFQHPIGVQYHEGVLYIADTYNHKIKKVDLQNRTVQTLIGSRRGYADGNALQARLNEPNDITFLDRLFYVMDTNNHLIRIYDPQTGQVSTLALRGADKLHRKSLQRHSLFPQGQELGTIALHPQGTKVSFHLPEGYELNLDAPHYYQLEEGMPMPLRSLSLTLHKPGRVEVGLYLCRKAEKSLCFQAVYSFTVQENLPNPSQEKTFSLPPLK